MTRNDDLESDLHLASSEANTRGVLEVLVLSDIDQVDLFPQERFATVGARATFMSCLLDVENYLQDIAPNIVFLSLSLAGKPSLDILDRCKNLLPKPLIVVVAANDQINDAAEAMHQGAFDCLFKPFSTTRLDQTLHEIVASLPLSDRPQPVAPTPVAQPENGATAPVPTASTIVQIGASAPLSYPQKVAAPCNQRGSPSIRQTKSSPKTHSDTQSRSPVKLSDLVGNHTGETALNRIIECLAASAAPVFIQGEVGTGKELYARAIHDLSDRSDGEFVVVDCAALRPETLASDIFGHLRGALPGAIHDKLGAAKLADGGTLYLDEIANLDFKVQNQFVRFLHTGKLQRLGEEQPTAVDVRIISSTSQDPGHLIEGNTLSKDLYYQLHVASIEVPPLRERGDVITELAQRFLLTFAGSEGRRFGAFAPEALSYLRAHSWPGNVHELKNIIWNAVLKHDGTLLTRDMLPSVECPQPTQYLNSSAIKASQAVDPSGLIGRSLAEIEQIVIEETIRAEGGSVPKAARTLGVSPSTIYRKREGWQS